MMPSTSSPTPQKASQLRRFGPLVVLVALALIIGAVVLLGGGDGKKAATSASSSSTGGASTAVAGAVSFSEARAQGRTDVTFPATCDQQTGRVAIPFHFAGECYANVADNGGATAKGVTADAITVVVYVAPDTDPIIDYITAAIRNNDTSQQVEDTYAGYTAMFQRYYQTYGRKVQLKFLRGSGFANDAIAARADAVKAAEEMGAFAVWGGPVLSDAWTQEIKARGVICIACPGITDPAPDVFTVTPSAEQSTEVHAEYVSKKLAGKPAKFAGDPAMQNQTRKIAELYIDTGGNEKDTAAKLKQALKDRGVDLALQLSYTLDPARLQEQATNLISQLKSAGITTVLFNGDPVAPATFTREATSQQYFPEWVLGGVALADTTAFGRTYDQQQWAHAFGPSYLAARVAPEKSEFFSLYKWFNGVNPPAIDTAGVLFPQPALFFEGLQAAGPKLTPETFRQGLFSAKLPGSAKTAQLISFGDHGYWKGEDYNGIDDYTEVWWDPKATGPDEIRKQGTGMWQYVDGGQRYLPGSWPSDLKVFDPAGAVTIYDTPPADEVPKSYPSPAN